MKKNDTYHHVGLRQTLLEAARVLLQERGVEALALREVARRAGVSTAAPYHHFADKAALVAALRQESLADLDRIAQAAAQASIAPKEKLQAIGVDYVLYAIDHPADFRLMFRPEIATPLALHELANAPVYRVLREVIEEYLLAEGSGVDPNTAAITAWSLVHGLAALLVDGPLQPMTKNREAIRALAARVTQQINLT